MVGAAMWAVFGSGVPVWSASPGQDALDRGTELYRTGRFGEAIDAFRDATHLDPGLLKAWENLGWAHRRTGQDNEAIGVWETVLKIEPDRVEVINEIGAIWADRRAWEEALVRYRESLRLVPDQPHIRFRIAKIQEAAGQRKQAAREYHAAELAYLKQMETDPLDPALLTDLGWATRKQGKTRDAIRAWKQAVALHPEAEQLYRHLADATREIGDAASARIWYQKAWDAGPRLPQVAFRLADLSFQDGRDDEASQWLDRLAELPAAGSDWSLRVATLFLRHDRPERGASWFEDRIGTAGADARAKQALSRIYAFQGAAAYQAGRSEDAIERYRRALEYDPRSAGVLRDLGWAYWRAARWTECEGTWTRYVERYPRRPEAHNLLTQFHLAHRDYPAAIRTIQASLRLAPDQPGEQLKLAKALFWNGQFERAKESARDLAAAHPEDLGVQFFWGELLMQYHEYRAGEAQWRKVLALGSQSPRARYYWLRSRYNLGEYDAALAAAKEEIATAGPQEPLLRLLIEDAQVRDDTEEAARWYELAVQSFPERPAFWTELAALYRERGMIAASEATIERARSAHPDHLEILISTAESQRLARRYDEAYREYSALLIRYPRNRRVFIGLLNTLIEAARPREALDLLEGNRTTFFKDYEVQLLRGRILIAQRKAADARALFAQVASPATHYVPILLYHGLGEHPRSTNLSVTLFDSQLKALRDAGYTAITLRELVEMMDGQRGFPPKPILITFDDARIDSFQLGDPVLAKYGMKATMFVPTARILDDHPFFADWDMVRRYAKTGRWDLQGHGHHAHDLIPIDRAEQRGGFLVNRLWLEGQERIETREEYERRLEQDYQDTTRQLDAHVAGLRVVGYAFPFSEAGQENAGNEPDAADVNERLLFRYFRYGFVQDQNGYNEVDSSASGMLRRVNVPRSWTGARLLKHLAVHHPRHVAQMQLAKSWAWSGRYERSRAAFRSLDAQTPLLAGESAYQLAGVAFQQGLFREAQQQLQTAVFYGERSSESQDLMTRIQWENRPRVTPRFGTFQDANERTNWWSTIQVRYPLTSPVTLWAEAGAVRFTEEGLPDLPGREVTVGTEWQLANPLNLRARGRQRFIQQSANSLNYWLEGVYESDVHELRLQWASEDVDTVQAHELGLQSRGYVGSYLVRPVPGWDGSVFGSQRFYDDGNERMDLRAAIRHTLSPWPQWRLGLGVSYNDTRVQSDRYYTPEELIVGRGIVAYRRRWVSGWEVAGEGGLGVADDAIRGNSVVSDAAIQTVQAWTERFQSRLGWDYSRSPGYQSWLLEGSVSWRF
jgi:tetratricopeptide (TPR) repeat protein